MTMICIRQPGYLPHMGFFKKIQSCDIFVFLDDAQYTIRGWDNRNKIRNLNDSMWLTVPVSNYYKLKLNEVIIANDQKWQRKHIMAIKSSYQKAPYFKRYWEKIESILNKKWDKLIELNLALIEYINSELNIKTKRILLSELNVQKTGSERLLETCKKLKATSYLAGKMSHEYLDENIFQEEGIKIIYEEFQHPVYKQLHGEFIPNMSIIDLLFNEGDNAKDILYKSQNF